MALQNDFTKTLTGFDGQLTAANVYWKITQINGDKNNISYTIEGFKSDQQVYGYSYSFTPDVSDGAANFIQQAYVHAKTQAPFLSAADV